MERGSKNLENLKSWKKTNAVFIWRKKNYTSDDDEIIHIIVK